VVNLISNGEFKDGMIDSLPDDWSLNSAYPLIAPVFKLVEKNNRKVLLASGNDDDNCVGWLQTSFPIEGDKYYKLKVVFQKSDDLDPNKNLIFAFYSKLNESDTGLFNDGIFTYAMEENNTIVGENRFHLNAKGCFTGEVRIYFKLSGNAKAWISSISLEECDPIPKRLVKTTCVQGRASLETWGKAIDHAAKNGTDLFLLPETFYMEHTRLSTMDGVESIDGVSATFMSAKAKQHGIYVAGTFLLKDVDSHVYNAMMLFDRKGNLAGRYDKFHPFSVEMFRGVSPGNQVPVFKTDFGIVGMMVCYDSWFTDVAELLSLKGAEIILFPNAGYYPSLCIARSADNCVRIVASSTVHEPGIWDTTGAEVRNPNADPFRYANNNSTFSKVEVEYFEKVKMLSAVLDLSQSPSPHNWGGPLQSAPGGRRNRREQKCLLQDEIKKEIERWWEE
jgi:predicted amidohydrolase